MHRFVWKMSSRLNTFELRTGAREANGLGGRWYGRNSCCVSSVCFVTIAGCVRRLHTDSRQSPKVLHLLRRSAVRLLLQIFAENLCHTLPESDQGNTHGATSFSMPHSESGLHRRRGVWVGCPTLSAFHFLPSLPIELPIPKVRCLLSALPAMASASVLKAARGTRICHVAPPSSACP